MVKRLYSKVKNVIFTDPNLLLEEEKHLVSQPFYFEGNNGRAVLLIHGWTVVPYELRRLGIFLNENGYTVYSPMLTGHGTNYHDLEGIKWPIWLEDVRRAYDKLKENHEKVFVMGTSIGSNLGILLAGKKPDVAGLVLMATPYKIKMEKIVTFFARANLLFKKYKKKFYPPTFGVSTTITRLISYQTYPIASALETFGLVKIARKKLSEIKQPCLVMQSSSDHIVSRNSLEKIYSKIRSQKKEKKIIKKAYHTFISDIKNESVFQDILKFINGIK
jgi:carboxylesterase